MSDSLPALEERRSQIILEIAQLGHFRPGSIHAQFRCCGKPNCACARDENARHGPLMRLSRKIDGKTVQDTLSDPAQLRKAQREVDTFRRFRDLSAELVQVVGGGDGMQRADQVLPQAHEGRGLRGGRRGLGLGARGPCSRISRQCFAKGYT